jgi:EmrB/QacA subfamily drug resistance transporter
MAEPSECARPTARRPSPPGPPQPAGHTEPVAPARGRPSAATPPDGSPPPAGLDTRLVALGTVVVLGTLMSTLSTTIVNVATRTLGREFDTSITTVQWVLTGYLLAFASVIPMAGWAAERFGAKRVWIGALLLFMTGSALSGSAWSVGALIAFQILQGIAGGTLVPVGQAILTQAAGPLRMGRVMGMIAVPLLMGSLSGPVVGGVIISAVGWRWIFLVNLPIGALAVVAARRLLPRSRPQPSNHLDLLGLVLLCSGVAIFVYGASEAGVVGGFGNPRALIGMALGVALVGFYVPHARRQGPRALIDLALFRERSFSASASTLLMVSITRYGVLILMPLYWQVLRGESPFNTGLLLIPQTAGAAAAMPLAGWVADRAGVRVVVPVGILVGMMGTLAFSRLGADASLTVSSCALFLIGLGLGATVVPTTVAAYVTLPASAIPRATSTINTIQQLGGSIGTALLAVVLQRAISTEVPHFGGSALGPLPPGVRAQMEPALERAFGHTFWIAAALIAASLLPTLWLPRIARPVARSAMTDR